MQTERTRTHDSKAIASDSLGMYLREINRTPLLGRDEEAELARRKRKGDRAALDLLVRANLRFVVSVARKYANYGVPLEDLINDGNLGLIKAAERFDERRGSKFISYAVWWVRQSILQSLSRHARVVRLPLNRTNILHQVTTRTRSLHQELGRAPHVHEIADALDMSEADIREALNLTAASVSLDEPVTTDANGETLLDLLRDERPDTPESSAADEAFRDQIARALDTLSERERQILTLYFGLGDNQPHTLEAIGRRFGLTRERIRQIKERALARLRHSSRAAFFEGYVQEG